MRTGEPNSANTARAARRSRRGVTMAEILTAIAIMGVIAAVAIPHITGTLSASKETISRNLVETMNQAVHRFNQTNYELLYTGLAPSAQDEMLVLRTLQFRDPDRPKIGSPYLRTDWNPDGSTSLSDYRIVWSGVMYTLVLPGQPGTGIRVNFDGTDITTPFIFPPGFTMAGK
ncbi:MAG: type II secretion system protein [Roseimicrobium sp.]